MKSYEEHLKSLLSKTPTHHCHRSSALFPIFSNAECSMQLLFLNYWKLKRNIEHLLCRLYLRSIKGEVLLKKCFYIDQIKAYEIPLSHLVSKRYPFGGSLEIEFSSPDNLVFPFPAVVVHYQGKHFSTFVHAAQRSFNDEEDEKTNENKESIESGFNIYCTKTLYPFLTFINGKHPIKNQSLLLAAYNQHQKVIGSQITLSAAPYETTYIHLNHWLELKKHLQNQPGCLKIKLPSKGIFPRLIVGNRSNQSGALSVTHSYYDLVNKKETKDFWKTPQSDWQAASLLLPVFPMEQFETNVFFYPIYSPAAFEIDVEIYSLQGKKLKTIHNYFTSPKLAIFEKKELSKLALELCTNKHLLFKLIARPIENLKIPARIKVGYDVGFKKGGLACNICTNFYPANPDMDTKKNTFKWAPLMPKSIGGEIWCLNDAPKKNYSREANVNVTFYRQSDASSIKRKILIPPHGACRIACDHNLMNFLKEKTGWCTFESNNPYITTYTFSLHPSKMVGADHGF